MKKSRMLKTLLVLTVVFAMLIASAAMASAALVNFADADPVVEEPAAPVATPALDADGNPILDENGHAVLLDAKGNVILLDEEGNPVLDEDGNFVLAPVEAEELPEPEEEEEEEVIKPAEGAFKIMAYMWNFSDYYPGGH